MMLYKNKCYILLDSYYTDQVTLFHKKCMDNLDILNIAQLAIITLLKVSSVVIIPGMIVGLIVSLFQAMTQIQEMTLSFVPKVLVVFSALIIGSSFIGEELIKLTHEIMLHIGK